MSATDPSYRPWAGFMDAVRESSNKMEPHYSYPDTRPRPAPPVLERLSPENLAKAIGFEESGHPLTWHVPVHPDDLALVTAARARYVEKTAVPPEPPKPPVVLTPEQITAVAAVRAANQSYWGWFMVACLLLGFLHPGFWAFALVGLLFWRALLVILIYAIIFIIGTVIPVALGVWAGVHTHSWIVGILVTFGVIPALLFAGIFLWEL